MAGSITIPEAMKDPLRHFKSDPPWARLLALFIIQLPASLRAVSRPLVVIAAILCPWR